MTAAILVLLIGLAIFWLVFFKLKLLRLTPAWGFGFGLVFVHFFLIFLIGLRFVTPSANATVVQRTIQLIPRLPEPYPRDRRVGRRKYAGEERPAAVPVRPAPVRIQGSTTRSATRRSQAKRPCTPGGRRGADTESGASQSRIGLPAIPKGAFRQAREGAGRARGGCRAVDDAGELGRSEQWRGAG